MDLDRTFCPFHDACKTGTKCDRALTAEVQKYADEFAMGLIWQFMEKPECYKCKKHLDKRKLIC